MDRPNIILIVLDTMRRDALSIYGGRANTPNIAKLASESTVFNNAVAPSPWTIPSHASIFTGKYVSEHGINVKTVLNNNLRNISRKDEVLATKLKNMRYHTVGTVANSIISPEFGFDSGFDVFNNVEWRPTLQKPKVLKKYEQSNKTNILYHPGDISSFISWYRKDRALKKQASFPFIKGGNKVLNLSLTEVDHDPFFLFFNFMELHEPYLKQAVRPTSVEIGNHTFGYNQWSGAGTQILDFFGEKGLRTKHKKKIVDKYYKEAQVVDDYVGAIIDYLKANESYDNSLIIITSDHGQSLKDEGSYWLFHGHFLYDELVEVPLIVKYPKDLENENRSKVKNTNGCFSTTEIYRIIMEATEGRMYLGNSDNKIPVFSEAYGFSENAFEKFNKLFQKKPDTLKYLDSPRKAIFMEGYKLVINGKSGTVEEFSHNGKPIETEDREVMNSLLEELKIFIGTERFKLPNTTSKILIS